MIFYRPLSKQHSLFLLHLSLALLKNTSMQRAFYLIINILLIFKSVLNPKAVFFNPQMILTWDHCLMVDFF